MNKKEPKVDQTDFVLLLHKIIDYRVKQHMCHNNCKTIKKNKVIN